VTLSRVSAYRAHPALVLSPVRGLPISSGFMRSEYSALGYAVQKCWAAMSQFALREGSVRDRLSFAYLDFSLIDPDLVPDHEGVREDIKWIRSEVRRLGTPTITLRKIRSVTAVRIARRVLDVLTKLQNALESQGRDESAARAGGGRSSPPLIRRIATRRSKNPHRGA
jgi:hypothetical protein